MARKPRKDAPEERLKTPYDHVSEAFRDGFAPLRDGARRGPTLAVLFTGIVAAFACAGFASLAIERTGTTEFCTGCHVYDDFGAAYRRTIHFANASGVRAECGDCHIPYGHWPDTVAVKLRSGLSSFWAYTIGGVDTPAAFEARRPALVRSVWRQYKDRGSDFCANCHAPEHWDTDAQSLAARASHRAVDAGQAQCIDCHLGVAHALPASLPPDMPASVHPDGPPRARPVDPPTPAPVSAPEEQARVEARATAEPAAGGDSFAPCAACHGTFAPAAAQLATLDLEAFLEKLDTHLPAGGVVTALDAAQRRALHAHLLER
ncbi:MAG: NapC/NirT family cytochrome c [Pseudomonadales bacterium]|jgi:nitrate/TMAO reductase-like tetraheme cytochrome c subunit|nr:NapC/NirT family cytochrome c [Pseudomonadales bacterium]